MIATWPCARMLDSVCASVVTSSFVGFEATNRKHHPERRVDRAAHFNRTHRSASYKRVR